MKKISFILLTFLFVSLVSCDKDTQGDQSLIESSDSNNFLKSYYSESFSKGNSIIINNNTMLVTEVLSINQKTPIGYTVENISRNELVYFVDVNVQKNLLKSIDFNNKETVSFSLSDFFDNHKIKNIDDFSFLNLIENMDNTNTKRRFWGWSCGSCSTGLDRGNFRTCCHYVFWIENGCEQREC